MPINRDVLRTLLSKLSILQSEKNMWLAAGFYVELNIPWDPSARRSATLIDALGNKDLIGYLTGLNLRLATIEWWDSLPKSDLSAQMTKLSLEPIDQLEVSRQG